MSTPLVRPAALAAALSLATAGAAGAGTVRPPAPGTTFTGAPGSIELLTGASGLDLAAFTVRCGTTRARVALNDVALKRTARGYAFTFRGGAAFTFADDDGGANGSVTLTGRFSSTGRSARGTVRATVRRCGTRRLTWTARRAG